MWMDIYIGNFPASVKKRCMYSNEQKENNRRRKEEKWMKNQRIPEHKLNFTGEVSEALENIINIETQDTTSKEKVEVKQTNFEENK